MRSPASILVPLLGMLSLPGSARAEDPGEAVRIHCSPEDPKNQCPGPRCLCTEDTLEITFDGQSQSVLELDEFVPDAWIEMTVVMDVRSDDTAGPGTGVEGWSYGVAHDDAVLELLGGTLQDTDVESVTYLECCVGFNMRDIQTCDRVTDPECRNPIPGGGFLSALILSFTKPVNLEVRRNTIVRAQYRLRKDPGPGGSLIQVVDSLKQKGSPRVDINITVNGISRSPRLLVDGLIRRSGERFSRGDVDGSGRISISDILNVLYTAAGILEPRVQCQDLFDADDDGRLTVADGISLIRYLFQRGPKPPPPFLTCGGDPTLDALPCAESSCP